MNETSSTPNSNSATAQPAPHGVASATACAPAPKRRLRTPYKTMTVSPSDKLRVRILEIAQDTGRPSKEVLEGLLSTAAGMKIPWVLVEPKNGPDAGVAMEQVNEMVAQTYLCLRDAKGLIATHGADAQRVQVDGVLRKCLELWCHAQRLAAATFYDLATIDSAHETWRFLQESRLKVQQQLADEGAKVPKSDDDQLRRYRAQLGRMEKMLSLLERLGFDSRMP